MTSVIPSDDRLKMTELGGELDKLIEDFDRAVGVEVLKKTSERRPLFTNKYF